MVEIRELDGGRFEVFAEARHCERSRAPWALSRSRTHLPPTLPWRPTFLC